jgi:hypothetical protein
MIVLVAVILIAVARLRRGIGVSAVDPFAWTASTSRTAPSGGRVFGVDW